MYFGFAMTCRTVYLYICCVEVICETGSTSEQKLLTPERADAGLRLRTCLERIASQRRQKDQKTHHVCATTIASGTVHFRSIQQT